MTLTNLTPRFRSPRCKAASLLALPVGILLQIASPQAEAQQYATVILDPGHGGKDAGAVHGGVAEKDVNLSLALRVEKYLHDFGVNTAITRNRDLTLALKKRAHFASYFQKPLFVSLHYNAAPRLSAHGIETFYNSVASRPLAALIQNALVKSTHANDRGVRHGKFHVIRENVAPVSVLVEGGFLSNAQERAKVAHAGYRDVQARSIAAAIATYLGHSTRTQRPNPALLVNNQRPAAPAWQARAAGAPQPETLVMMTAPARATAARPGYLRKSGSLLKRLNPTKALKPLLAFRN